MSKEDFSTMRSAMVSSQLRTNAVNDPAVVAAMESVPRERFVPEDRAALAYVDVPVPLGNGRSLNPPLVTGRLLVESGVKAGDKVLLVGAATGYAAALLSEIGVHVAALDSDQTLTAKAKANGIAVVSGQLEAGLPEMAPYDAIIVDGAIETVPQAYWDQLKEGSMLATGLVEAGITRLATGRKAGGSGALLPFADIEAVRLPGFDAPRGFRF